MSKHHTPSTRSKAPALSSTAFEQRAASCLLNKREAAQSLAWSIRSIEMAMRAKRIAFIRFGRTIRFRQRDIEDFIERNRLRSIAG